MELAILGLLKEHPMHGYDLRKRLRSDFGLLSSLSFGSLYPALGRLESSGAVRELDVAPGGSGRTRPDSESLTTVIPFSGSITGERAAFRARLAARSSRATSTPSTQVAQPAPTGSASRTPRSTRARKVYEITPAGEALFEQLLAEEPAPSEDGRSFSVRWVFARHLPPEARLRLLERRRRQIEDRLDDVARRAAAPPRPLDRFERSILEHSREALRCDLEWIDRLTSAERESLEPEPETEVS